MYLSTLYKAPSSTKRNAEKWEYVSSSSPYSFLFSFCVPRTPPLCARFLIFFVFFSFFIFLCFPPFFSLFRPLSPPVVPLFFFCFSLSFFFFFVCVVPITLFRLYFPPAQSFFFFRLATSVPPLERSPFPSLVFLFFKSFIFVSKLRMDGFESLFSPIVSMCRSTSVSFLPEAEPFSGPSN